MSEFFSDGTPVPEEPNIDLVSDLYEEPEDPIDAVIGGGELGSGLVKVESFSNPVSASEVMLSALHEINQGGGIWEMLAARGNLEDDCYRMDFVSNGQIPFIEPEDFGDLTAAITIDREPGVETRGVHFVRFEGSRYELGDFAIILREKLAFPDQDPEDVLKGMPLPMMLFASIASRRS